nr:MAG TPA: hypothetical protein [Caudoviricetes sp.]
MCGALAYVDGRGEAARLWQQRSWGNSAALRQTLPRWRRR